MMYMLSFFLALLSMVACLRPNQNFRRYRNKQHSHINQHSNFLTTRGPTPSTAIPSAVSNQLLVKSLIQAADEQKAIRFLTGMTSFPERYYRSQNGIKSAEWIRDQVLSLNSSASSSVRLSIKLFDHSWKMQPSVIARLENVNSEAEDIVITGSHLDTIAYGTIHREPNANPAADDCASGSTVVFETLRVLIQEKFVPHHPIEFHWYSGEEEGIYGSSEVAEDYAKRGVNVLSYLNLDQSGYVKPGTSPVIGILVDHSTSESISFARKIASAYGNQPSADVKCGYACTDNDSWWKHGYQATSFFESLQQNAFPYNDRVKIDGTALDTIDVITFSHLMEFVKVTLGYVVELSLTKE